jgi:hypothetical protein
MSQLESNIALSEETLRRGRTSSSSPARSTCGNGPAPVNLATTSGTEAHLKLVPRRQSVGPCASRDADPRPVVRLHPYG